MGGAGDSSRQGKIDIYLKLLKTDPDNCSYFEQIASNYQALNKFDQAIYFYKKAVEKCRDSIIDKFQLGVCYYLTMERSTGIRYMEDAIDEAKRINDEKTLSMLIQEKKDWLEKWEQVKELEWNKNKVEK
jgi:tetratricopeptide (TPR) repeat protein